MNYLSSVPALLDCLAPAVRVRIAGATGSAMRGGLEAALATLEDSSEDISVIDATARQLARAFLLHLNRQAAEALAVIDGAVLSNLYRLPEEIRMVIEQDRIEITFGAGFPDRGEVERHYGQVDRRRLLGVDWRDAGALLDAGEASAAGRNYDSLPVYASLLNEAYRHCNWRQIRKSAGDLCRETLRLGDAVHAVFYAVLSEDESMAKSIAEHLRAANDASVLAAALARLAEISHLSRNVTCACHFLTHLGDTIPDSTVAIWLDRLRAARKLPGATVLEHWESDPAWAATTHLLSGATPAQADSIIDEVLSHPRWAGNDIGRISFFEPLAAGARIATEVACRKLQDAVIPLLLTPGHDFRDALRVVIVLAERSPENNAEIAGRIYVKGRAVPHLLAAVASLFDKPIRFGEPDKLAAMAIDHLPLQVERLAAGAQPRTGYGETVIQSTNGPEGTIAVKIGSSAEELQAIATYRKDLSPKVLADLIAVVLETIRDSDNINANRIMLFGILRRFADVVDLELAEQIAKVADAFARDHRASSHPLHGQSEEHSALNPFRMGDGWPQEVRGAALLLLAEMGRRHPRSVPGLSDFLIAGMADANPVVRQHCYRALAIADYLAESCLASVVSGTRDIDTTAANIALQVVGVLAPEVIKQGLLSAVTGVLEVQSRSPDVSVRFAAAVVVRQLRRALGNESTPAAGRLDILAERLGRDVSRRVHTASVASAD